MVIFSFVEHSGWVHTPVWGRGGGGGEGCLANALRWQGDGVDVVEFWRDER